MMIIITAGTKVSLIVPWCCPIKSTEDTLLSSIWLFNWCSDGSRCENMWLHFGKTAQKQLQGNTHNKRTHLSSGVNTSSTHWITGRRLSGWLVNFQFGEKRHTFVLNKNILTGLMELSANINIGHKHMIPKTGGKFHCGEGSSEQRANIGWV